jgi:hypothetical protein
MDIALDEPPIEDDDGGGGGASPREAKSKLEKSNSSEVFDPYLGKWYEWQPRRRVWCAFDRHNGH